ncbi:MAG: hypothetical protein IKN50_00820 [Clostridia bacterium]|nr:hypothetical protein [Clostridia bacterium]
MNEKVKKLDSALADWEKVSSILSETALVRAIRCIRDRELVKPDGECDFGLIEEATEELLALNREDPDEVRAYAECRVEQNLKSFTETSSRKASAGRRVAGRVLPVVAAVAAGLIAAVVTCYALGFDVFTMTADFFSSLANKQVYRDEAGSVEIIKTDDAERFGTLSAALEAIPIDGCFSSPLFDDPNRVEYVDSVDFGTHRQIRAVMKSGSVREFEITYPSPVSELPATDRKIGEFDVYLSSYDGAYQAEWIANGALYIMTADSEDELISAIGSLK